MYPPLDMRALAFVLAPFLAGDAPPGEPVATSSGAAEVAARLATELERSYVFEDKGAAMARALREKTAANAWEGLAGQRLADALTETCRAFGNDKHLRVRHDGPDAPRPQSAFLLDPGAARREWTRRNHGFERAERLQGNVGYLEIREFVPADLSRATASAALAFLQDTDALVIDLRRNGGGEAGAVRFLCSYFFGEEPVLLNTLVNREQGLVEEYWTLRDLPGRRYLEKPVYVLVGAKTFSAAEECAYDLQSRGRATIVGRTTGGGAHPVDRRPLGPGYSVMLPVARAENPVTKTNWEGVGVLPDVDAPEEAALERAWTLALEAILAREKDEARRNELRELIAERKAESAR